jgi:hypothetical protein
MTKFWKNNSLSIVFCGLFIITLLGQYITGWCQYNEERQQYHYAAISFVSYFTTGHFSQATFENWESEFLQMALFVLFTIWLKQKGSSESKSSDEKEEVDRTPSARRKDVPWPVKKGGWVLKVYSNSLTIALIFLFLLSWWLHFEGSLHSENDERMMRGLEPEKASSYLASSRFWFESFQNWQSEFLSVFAIVILSVFLRQKGSPQSKPVDASDGETGE